jgi:hypothetical protein
LYLLIFSFQRIASKRLRTLDFSRTASQNQGIGCTLA